MKSLNQELTELEPIVKTISKILNYRKINCDKELLADDKEMIAIASEELKKYEVDLKETESKIIEATVEKDPNDARDIY